MTNPVDNRSIFVLVIYMSLIVIGIPVSAQQIDPLPAIIVLDTDGDISSLRDGWRAPVTVQPGTRIAIGDTIFSNNAALLVLCPDGQLLDVFPGQLQPEDTINCEPSRSDGLIEVDGIHVPTLQRGGLQNSSIPYLISPRNTLIRDTNVEIRWNNPGDVLEYKLRVFGGGDTVYPQTAFDPNNVLQPEGNSNTVMLPLDLQPGVPYSIQICVLFADLREGCTTDAGWSAGTNVAFYYNPDPHLGGQSVSNVEQKIIAQVGEDTPQSLYARAVLFSEGMIVTESGVSLGLRNEAIDLLNRLLTDHPESVLAQSAEVHYLLGSLYETIDLPLSAAWAYTQAQSFATGCSETAARIAYGLANTEPNGDNTVRHLIVSLENYNCLLETGPFAVQYAEICNAIGDTCDDLPAVNEF